ncbi:MAG: RusA family crossover junction endodeoxyribonuclease [Actinomycetota bacterium]|nr:RusA family crossover junction endodeoxyribonuclease [Actinomycetota bacterium]
MSLSLTIPGEPVALQRHRHTRNGRTYNPPANVEYAERIKLAWRDAGSPKVEGPLTLSARFYLPRPRSHHRSGRFSRFLKPSAPALPDGKPDLSNLVKGLEDALNGCAYADDAKIVCYSGCHKLYADHGLPRAELDLWLATAPYLTAEQNRDVTEALLEVA